MRVRIAYTVDVDDDFRRAINVHYGKDGLATREDVKRWYESYGDSMNVDLMNEYEQSFAAYDTDRDEIS